MTHPAPGGFSESLLHMATANTAPASASPAPAVATAADPAAAAVPPAATLDDIAACAAMLVRMSAAAMRAGPSQKISAGHADQLCRRLEAMLQSAGFTERDVLWDALKRPGGPAPSRFLA